MRIEPASAWPWAFRPPADDVPAGTKARIPEGKWRIAAGSQQDGVIGSALSVTSTGSGERYFGLRRRGQASGLVDLSLTRGDPCGTRRVLGRSVLEARVPRTQGNGVATVELPPEWGRRVPPLTLRASSSVDRPEPCGRGGLCSLAHSKDGHAQFDVGRADAQDRRTRLPHLLRDADTSLLPRPPARESSVCALLGREEA